MTVKTKDDLVYIGVAGLGCFYLLLRGLWWALKIGAIIAAAWVILKLAGVL